MYHENDLPAIGHLMVRWSYLIEVGSNEKQTGQLGMENLVKPLA